MKKSQRAKAAGVLSSSMRSALPETDFVFPATSSYPINDENHARNALARVVQFGTPDEITAVKAAVSKKFPSIKVKDNDT